MESVRLRFLGCGDAFFSGGRSHTCFQLEGGGEPLLVDCGVTSLVALKHGAIDPASIGWIAISHLHGDHFAGLPWLILDGRFAKRTNPLVIAGPPTTSERLERTFEALYPGAPGAELPFELRFLELSDRKPCELGEAIVTPFEVVHSSGADSFALRIEYGGKVVAYSGDTEWTGSLIDVSEGADLFVCECNQFDEQAPGHLDYRTLQAKRPLLHCKRIVLTHMNDEMLSHLAEVEIETAVDGMVVAV